MKMVLVFLVTIGLLAGAFANAVDKGLSTKHPITKAIKARHAQIEELTK